jgi:anti-sigma-K factor RskA
MKKGWIAVGLVATLALTAGVAFAQGHRQEPDFATMDADGDGAVTLAEFTAFTQDRAATQAERMFTRVDADGDGMVTQAEIEAAREAHGGRHGKSARE